MSRWTRIVPTCAVIVTVVAAAAYIWQADQADAADHTDPPMRVSAGDPADIGDLYAWHSDNTLKTVLTFAGPLAPAADQTGTYDGDVLYGIHIDNNGDNVPDHDIWVRFGQNAFGDWGAQFVGIPGANGDLIGGVGDMVEGDGGTKAWVGLRDDPFFFDLQGFGETLDTGILAFNSARDSFAGANITAIVLEMPVSALGGSEIQVWATTADMGE